MVEPLVTPPDAALILADGTVFSGHGIGAPGTTAGEICFNTAMTGYQEVLTDPSYCGQIITFTFPHIGNVGTNAEDIESEKPCIAGLVLREDITESSNFRAESSLNDWLKKYGITGICGIDTRALTRHIRIKGAQNAAIVYATSGKLDLKAAKKLLNEAPDMTGLELAAKVTTKESYSWSQGKWELGKGYEDTLRSAKTRAGAEGERGGAVAGAGRPPARSATYKVVAIDYGEKLNILRSLASHDCRVTVVPGTTGAEEIFKLKPDGVFLSNGPGDPAATGKYAVPVIQKIIAAGIPLFGICLGHQLLGLALGATTEKMQQGHRGANHPVKDLTTGKVEITSQNHGFCVSETKMPKDVEITHRSLFDNCVEGLRLKNKPIFSVQYHPESSPGPHDSDYLFARFVAMMAANKKRAA